MAVNHDGKPLYDTIAEAYAKRVDTAPYNAYYERPAMLELLPSVEGCDVLDAGCGSGWYCEQLTARGACVTAIDASSTMLNYARARLNGRADFHVADLGQPLDFAADSSFDLVISPLVLHYLADLVPTFREFRRVLRPEGRLVFSTHHPGYEAERLGITRYFDVELIEEEWDDVGLVRFYRRPLSAIFESLWAAGFLVERVVEPLPTDEIRNVDPSAYERLLRRPAFLLLRARLGGNS